MAMWRGRWTAIQHLVRVQAAQERGLRRDLRRWLAAVADCAATEFAEHGTTRCPTDQQERQLAAILRARNSAAIREAARMARIMVRGSQPKSLGVAQFKRAEIEITPALAAALEWAIEHALNEARQISEAQRQRFRKRITEGLGEGLGVRPIAKRIREDEGGDIGRVRAERIARTETHAAMQRGGYDIARETGREIGLDIIKEWGATEDKRTRPAHAEADGQIRRLESAFVVDGEELMYPGDTRGSPGNVINCRCVALYRPLMPDEALEP